MIATALNTRPFAFDTEFASDGEIMRTGAVFAPTKRSYLPAEVEALVAQARLEARELALACARVMTSAALTRFPTGPLQDALEQLGSEIDASPRLVIRAGGLDEAVKARLQAVCIDAGFSGLIAFRDDPGMALAAFHLEWADGRADFDPAEAAERIGGALTAALAAEAGHAEPLNGSH